LHNIRTLRIEQYEIELSGRSNHLHHIRTSKAEMMEQNMQDLQDIKRQMVSGTLMLESFDAQTKQHVAVEAEIKRAVQNWTEADRSAMQQLLKAHPKSFGLPLGYIFKCALEEMNALINDACMPEQVKDLSQCCMEAYCNFRQVLNGREKYSEQTLRELLEWWVGNDCSNDFTDTDLAMSCCYRHRHRNVEA